MFYCRNKSLVDWGFFYESLLRLRWKGNALCLLSGQRDIIFLYGNVHLFDTSLVFLLFALHTDCLILELLSLVSQEAYPSDSCCRTVTTTNIQGIEHARTMLQNNIPERVYWALLQYLNWTAKISRCLSDCFPFSSSSFFVPSISWIRNPFSSNGKSPFVWPHLKREQF